MRTLSKVVGISGACLVFMFSPPVFGQINSVDLSGLTEKQKAELVRQAENMKTEATQTQNTETVNKWVDTGKNVALAITTVAKDLGIAADTFMESTTGKITAATVLWIVLGKDIIQIAVGLLLFGVGLPLWVYFFRRLCVIKSIVTTPTEGRWRVKKGITYYEEGEVDNTRWTMLILLVLSICVILFVIFA